MSRISHLVSSSGAYGLVGRGLLERFPGLLPLELGEPPEELRARLRPRHPVAPLDLTDRSAVDRALTSLASAAAGAPLVVLHLAALTDTRGTDATAFHRVNVEGTRNLMAATQRVGGSFIHISTDYVFAGESRRTEPFAETDRPTQRPSEPYAASKFDAEALVLSLGVPERTAVARIAFPYGGEGNRPGLEDKMRGWLAKAKAEGRPARLFADQAICPSFIPDTHAGLERIVERAAAGTLPPRAVFHLVGAPTTPFEMAGLVQEAFGITGATREATSVVGTPYAQNLRLSTDWTRRELGWAPTPHAEALALIARRTPGTR